MSMVEVLWCLIMTFFYDPLSLPFHLVLALYSWYKAGEFREIFLWSWEGGVRRPIVTKENICKGSQNLYGIKGPSCCCLYPLWDLGRESYWWGSIGQSSWKTSNFRHLKWLLWGSILTNKQSNRATHSCSNFLLEFPFKCSFMHYCLLLYECVNFKAHQWREVGKWWFNWILSSMSIKINYLKESTVSTSVYTKGLKIWPTLNNVHIIM